jgi:hypothetical protein
MLVELWKVTRGGFFMSHICPQCSLENPDSTVFCTRCGYRFNGNEQSVADLSTIHPSSLANIPADADPASTLARGGQQPQVAQPVGATPQQQPALTPVPATPAYIPTMAVPNANQPLPQGAFYAPQQQPQGGYPQQQQPQGGYAPQQQVYAQQQQPPYGLPPGAAPNTGAGLTGLQRAFAGKGAPVHHQSWLLDNKQAQPALLRTSLIENIQKQGVLGLSAGPERLRELGVVMEERDYVKVQYGISAVLVYFAPMGQNLYISRTSVVQQPYSRIRQYVLLSLLFLWLISLLLFAVIHPTDGFTDAIRTIFSYLFFGLFFFYIYVLIRSLVSWLTEKDFLAYLRPNQLNDFTLDALSSIEQITDKAIRETVKQAGLNSADVIVPTQSYGLSQPLHRI